MVAVILLLWEAGIDGSKVQAQLGQSSELREILPPKILKWWWGTRDALSI